MPANLPLVGDIAQLEDNSGRKLGSINSGNDIKHVHFICGEEETKLVSSVAYNWFITSIIMYTGSWSTKTSQEIEEALLHRS